jgi:hypothetical protein
MEGRNYQAMDLARSLIEWRRAAVNKICQPSDLPIPGYNLLQLNPATGFPSVKLFPRHQTSFPGGTRKEMEKDKIRFDAYLTVGNSDFISFAGERMKMFEKG